MSLTDSYHILFEGNGRKQDNFWHQKRTEARQEHQTVNHDNVFVVDKYCGSNINSYFYTFIFILATVLIIMSYSQSKNR